ncbi:uncharacterized protein LOC106090710 [Stomoxys calcitrans]|uniref:uncharacterized protein LOC106090710 n=1 Tax=Stomoxys calcitrans TaxID=35570 RepID=UPI0027E23D00|nr:uncharacterized protein LOC106090710 [Stomoxys calcitrans]
MFPAKPVFNLKPNTHRPPIVLLQGLLDNGLGIWTLWQWLEGIGLLPKIDVFTFKLKILETFYEELFRIHQQTIEFSSVECRKQNTIDVNSCQNYRYQDSCQSFMPSLPQLIPKLLAGVIVKTKDSHWSY